jgi:hypothetical protein
MRTLRKLAAALLLGLATTAGAQVYYDEWDYAYDFAPSTGDPLFDDILYQVNALYGHEPRWYVDDIVRSTGAPRYYVEPLIIQKRYAPADVYMIAETARLSGRSFASVQREFDATRGVGEGQGEGWGVLARRMGIKPGSAEFHSLKNGATQLSSRVDTQIKGRGIARRGAPANRRPVGVSPAVVGPGTVKAKPGKGPGYGKVKDNPGKGKGKGNGKNKDKG